MRCLALARALVRDGAAVSFLSRADAGDFMRPMHAAGVPIQWIAAPPRLDPEADAAACAALLCQDPVDWLILDRHGLGAHWQRRLRPWAKQILVIDDLADTVHHCDLLLNPNLPISPADYQGLVPLRCQLLLGPEYALLGRDYFRCAPRRCDGRVRRLLVSFGGSDPAGASRLALHALAELSADGQLDAVERILLVAGPGNPAWPELRELSRCVANLRVVRSVRAMAAQLQAADLVIGAAGGSLWERCWLGVPALVLALVPHQEPVAEALASRGAIRYLGPVGRVDARGLANEVAALLRDAETLRAIGSAARALIGQARFAQSPRAFLEAVRPAAYA